MDLMIIPAANLPTILAADDKDIIGSLKRELDGWKADVTTVHGRAEIATKKNKVSTAKQDLLRIAKTLKADHQAVLKGIQTEERVIEERFDALRDEIGRPLDEFRAREKNRVAAHEGLLAKVESAAVFDDRTWVGDVRIEDINGRIEWLNGLEGHRWEEFEDRGIAAVTASIGSLCKLRADLVRKAEDAAELERLRAEEAKRQAEDDLKAQIAREERIAAEAAKAAARQVQEAAERAAKEAEERAQAALKAAEALRAHQAEEAARKEREAAEALARVEREKRETEEKAQRDRIAAEQAAVRAAEKVEADRIAAEQRAERDKAAALEAERQRIAREAEAKRLADEKRAANVAHQTKINRAALAGILAVLTAHWVDDDITPEIMAKHIVTALAKGEVEFVKVLY